MYCVKQIFPSVDTDKLVIINLQPRKIMQA